MPIKIVKKGDATAHLRSLYGRLHHGFAVVGVLDGNVPHGDGRLTVGEVAAIHEFGAPSRGIPARSFLRLGMKKARVPVMSLAKIIFAKVARGEATDREALTKIADIMISTTTACFSTRGFGTWQDLAESTIARKGHADPLLDTEQLKQSIKAEVWLSDARPAR